MQQNAYPNLEKHFLKISRLENARAILGWDEAVMMPAGSSQSRNETMAELAMLIQSLNTDPRVGEWLAECDGADLGEWERANLREMKRIHRENTAVAPELTERLVLARMNCEQKWRVMRAENDWRGFAPHLAEVIELTREMLRSLSAAEGLSLYDTALSLFSNGLTTETVENLFGEIKAFLPAMIDEVIERQKSEPVLTPQGTFPAAVQKALGLELMKAVGFSFSNGRLDESHHPFCGGTSRDVRITTRYDEKDFVPALMGVLHETGHAMYEQHLPGKWQGQPVGAAAGMAIHESQSLMLEMQICRSPAFLNFAAPYIRKHMSPYISDVRALEPENLSRLVTRVKRGFIRVDADEVTYPAHVILRFELERALLEGTLSPADLPAAWDEKMRAYLGLSTLGNDRDGCMQDVHWPAGMLGYFPAYTFGAVIAAQLFARIVAEHAGVQDEIARGDFSSVQSWLNKNIWSQGTCFSTAELVRRAAGPLSARSFQAHLQSRYLG